MVDATSLQINFNYKNKRKNLKSWKGYTIRITRNFGGTL